MYNFLLQEQIERTNLLWKQINQIDEYWFSDFGPMITPLYLDIFHNGYDITTKYIIEYEKEIYNLNSKLKYFNINKNNQFRLLRKEYSYEMEHMESIWEKEQKMYIYDSCDDDSY